MTNNHYLSVMDAWSNASFVGPYLTKAAAWQARAAMPAQFDVYVVTEAEYLANISEFGPVTLTAPEA